MRRGLVGAAWLLVPALLIGSTGCGANVPVAATRDRAQVRVAMFTTSWCPVCSRARSWFHRRGIPFDEYDVESTPGAMARLRRLNPGASVPTLQIEGQVVVGFDSEHVRQVVDTAAHRYCVADRGEDECAPDEPGR